MKKCIISLLHLLILCNIVNSEPPPYEKFRIKKGNNKYTSKLRIKNKKVNIYLKGSYRWYHEFSGGFLIHIKNPTKEKVTVDTRNIYIESKKYKYSFILNDVREPYATFGSDTSSDLTWMDSKEPPDNPIVVIESKSAIYIRYKLRMLERTTHYWNILDEDEVITMYFKNAITIGDYDIEISPIIIVPAKSPKNKDNIRIYTPIINNVSSKLNTNTNEVNITFSLKRSAYVEIDIYANPNNEIHAYDFSKSIESKKYEIGSHEVVERIHNDDKELDIVEYFIQIDADYGSGDDDRVFLRGK